MRKYYLSLILIILFFGGCGASSNDTPGYSIRSSDCKGLSEIQGQECYMLSVKENRNYPGSRFIDVFVVVLRALNKKPTGKPTVFLHGGPGNVGTDLIGYFNTEPFRRDHDLIFFNQRGIGRSNPSILCKNMNSLLMADPLVIRECLAEFKTAGADIRGYDTRQSALDLKELRQSLGIEQWNVYGLSYGTRYSLDLMRVDAEGTAAVVLDSPMTTSDPNNTTDLNLNAQRVFNLMFEDCKAQPACNSAYPDLKQKFYAVADYIKQNPIVLEVKNPVTGVMTPLVRSVEDYVEKVDSSIGVQDSAKFVPSLIDRMHKHVTGQSVMTSQQLDQYFGNNDPSTFGNSSYFGTALGIFCREIYPKLDFVSLDIARAPLFPFGIHNQAESLWRAACPMASAGEIEKGFWEPVTSAKPVLILSGTYDTATPRAWAEKAAGTLSNATLVPIPAAGHILLTLTCPRTLMAAFLDNPSAKLDTSCVLTMPQMPVFESIDRPIPALTSHPIVTSRFFIIFP
jgi:pimeloyl-ACP methyl ester carboxylesterase